MAKVRVLEVVMMPVDRPIDYADNHKAHTPETIKKLCRLIEEFGFTNPVLLDENEVILAGHRRRAAANLVGLSDIPTITITGLTDAQKMALRIADNRSAEDSDTDTATLLAELRKLDELGYDLLNTGHDADELVKLLHQTADGETDADDVPDTPLVAVTLPGDVWELGSHRIICGDSTDAATVEKVLGGVKPHLMVTDPPYGVNYDPEWRNIATRPDGTRLGATATGKVLNDDRADWTEAWNLFPGDVAYVWHAGLFASEVDFSLRASGFEVKSQIIWKKQNFAIGRADYHWQHEAAWYVVRGKAKSHHWGGDRTQSTMWDVPTLNPVGRKGGEQKGDEKTGHGTQKPVELFARCIRNNSNPGQAVYEPFSGSGTCIIAAEREGRLCYAIELNPAYCDVAVTRWSAYTGKPAVLMATGQTFAEVLAERTPESRTGQRGVKA